MSGSSLINLKLQGCCQTHKNWTHKGHGNLTKMAMQ